MKTGRNVSIVLVTVPDRRIARALAGAALEARLIACANILPGVESHYWWKGKREKGSELLLLLKTTRRTLRELEKLIIQLHPYDTPEFVVLGVDRVTSKYFAWWLEEVRSRQ